MEEGDTHEGEGEDGEGTEEGGAACSHYSAKASHPPPSPVSARSASQQASGTRASVTSASTAAAKTTRVGERGEPPSLRPPPAVQTRAPLALRVSPSLATKAPTAPVSASPDTSATSCSPGQLPSAEKALEVPPPFPAPTRCISRADDASSPPSRQGLLSDHKGGSSREPDVVVVHVAFLGVRLVDLLSLGVAGRGEEKRRGGGEGLRLRADRGRMEACGGGKGWDILGGRGGRKRCSEGAEEGRAGREGEASI